METQEHVHECACEHAFARCGTKWIHAVLLADCQWPNPWICPDCEIAEGAH